MPTEDDYARRQVVLQHASTPPAPLPPCPAGCPVAAQLVPADRYPSTYGSEKTLSDRFEPPERFQTERFGSERSHSDRLPSGERYQGASERYPLGDRPQTAVSSDRLQVSERQNFQPERYHYSDRRYQERGIGSLDRYNGYTRTNTPTDRYNTLSNDKDRCGTERYEKYQGGSTERHSSSQSVCSDRYTPTERHRTQEYPNNGSKTLPSEVYKFKDRKYQQNTTYQRYEYDRYQPDRYPAIPCPERFASQERTPFTQVPYMEPPSPAPASDRFIPPPPLSPTNTPSPDCYPSNPFPSPTNVPPQSFIPPPPLSPSPTENYSPKRYPTPNQYRYYNYQTTYHEPNKYLDQRYPTERYVPPNAHTPVERYVPQPQEPYYYYDRYQKFNANDPYMRRDLAFHYRLPVPYHPSQYPQRIRYLGTPNRIKCCQYQDGYQISKSSPGSSSSSSVTSQGKDYHAQKESNLQEIQCQNYQNYQQEKGIQCNKDAVQCVGYKDVASPNIRKGQCRHGMCASPSVEYMGASGGRHVSATPPPPRGPVGPPVDGTACIDQCCNRKTQNLTVSVWRATPTSQQSQPSSQQATPPSQSHQSPEPSKQTPSPPAQPQEPSTHTDEVQVVQQSPQSAASASVPKPPPAARAVSLPAPSAPPAELVQRVQYSQSERNARERPRLARSNSRKEVIKNYIKRETATFFGVCEDNESAQQERWLDRRKRLASRTYGALKEDYQLPSTRTSRVPWESIRNQAPTGQLQMERPDVLPGPSDVPDASASPEEEARSKDSVARMTWDGLSYVVTTITRHQQRERSQRASRSYPPEIPNQGRLPAEEGGFFARPSSSFSPDSPQADSIDRGPAQEADALEPLRQPSLRYSNRAPTGWQRDIHPGWRRDPHTVSRGEQTRPTVGGERIYASSLDRALDNSNRRQYGMGWVGKFFGRSFKKSVANEASVRKQLDDMEDYRPMFTYWVTTVQVLVLTIALICYGFGPFGVDLEARSGQVLVTSLSLQQVDYMEPANFWFGPRAADLIHLGAKFAPCMRLDKTIIQKIEMTRAKERETACCIRNDDSGCVQSSQADCSKTISTWKKWSAGESGPGGRISGSVCGLDPKFCDAPASVHPYEWPDDITKWPICRKTNTQSSVQKRGGPRDRLAEHMVCEVIGHPCCIGIHGQCRITTREYCDFVRGTFHEEASLCSQVSCLNDVCGMIPFYFFEIPDQFYRLWTSIFLHAGILQLFITILIQYFLMRDLEKLTGSMRIGIIYIGSGVAGNLASAIFVPYRADVGPAGCQFGLLACLIVEVINAWPMLKHPNQALMKLFAITFALFLIGLLPWVDNYAHLFGFVFGFLLSYALLPFVSFGPYDRQRKVVLIWVCLVSAGFLFVCLVLLFYIFPVYDCKICSYLSCLPLTRDFCASQNINFMREEPVV